MSCPVHLLLLRVPPHELLALAPRLAVRVRRGAVVEHAAVRGPRPAPLGVVRALLPVRHAARGLVHPVRVDAGVDPAAAGGGAVGFELEIAVDGRTGGDVVAVDAPQDVFGRRLRPRPRALHVVAPVQLLHRLVARVRRRRQPLLDHPAQVVEEPQVRALVAGRLDRLLPPLDHALGLGERALLLHVRGGGEEEHLRAARLGADLAGLDLRRVLPERGALDHGEVADDHPVEVRHAQALQLAVRRADGRVLPEQEVAEHLPAVHHVHDRAVRAVVAADPRQEVEAEVVLGRGVLAEVLLEQRHHVGVGRRPVALLGAAADGVQVGGEVFGRFHAGHRQVAGQQVEQRRDVRRALDAGVPAQGEHAAARPADVAQQQLDDRTGADVLRADAVLRPSDAVDQRRGALPVRVRRPRLADRPELLRRRAADALDHLRGVAGEVPLEDLEHAARVLQRRVLGDAVGGVVERSPARPRLHRARLLLVLGRVAGVLVDLTRALVLPAAAVVRRRVGVVTTEQPVQILRVPVLVRDEGRGVRERRDVLAEVQVVGQDVVDQAAEERDVSARADRHVGVGDSAGAGEARVDVDHFRAAGLGLHHPLEPDRMGLGHVRAHDDDAV